MKNNNKKPAGFSWDDFTSELERNEESGKISPDSVVEGSLGGMGVFSDGVEKRRGRARSKTIVEPTAEEMKKEKQTAAVNAKFNEKYQAFLSQEQSAASTEQELLPSGQPLS